MGITPKGGPKTPFFNIYTLSHAPSQPNFSHGGYKSQGVPTPPFFKSEKGGIESIFFRLSLFQWPKSYFLPLRKGRGAMVVGWNIYWVQYLSYSIMRVGLFGSECMLNIYKLLLNILKNSCLYGKSFVKMGHFYRPFFLNI